LAHAEADTENASRLAQRDTGERSCSIISLKKGKGGQWRRKNLKESKRISPKNFDEFRSHDNAQTVIKPQQLLLQREPIKTRSARSEHSQGGAQRSEQYLYDT
jgi:hypothetical protein